MKKLMKKLYSFWIIFGNALGTMNAYLIMTLVYFIIIGPIGLALRLFRVDVLHRRKPKNSNWMPVEKMGDDLNAYQRLS